MKRNTLMGSVWSCLFLLILVSGCKTTSKTTTRTKVRSNTGTTVFDQITKSSDVNALVKTMTGSFSSATQAKDDTTYMDISLHMYPIWKSKEDKYLYVEQAITAESDKPYRQRVYKLVSDGNGGFENHIYKIENEAQFVGKWKNSSFFDKYGEELLKEQVGCTVYLSKHADGSYSGSTRMDHCKSTLSGTSYETSMVKFRETSVMSWDQGFDAAGLQVSGAEKGGYRFVRVAN